MTPLVLLPGMLCDARIFAPQIAALSPDHAVHVAPISRHADVTSLAGEVLRHAPPAFALAGLSMGGIVAMEIARLAPARVERIALLDTNSLPDRPEQAAARERQIARAGRDLGLVMREELMPHFVTEGPDADAILALCLDMALTLGSDVFARQSRALATRPDQSETLRRLDLPALVLCGAADRLCPPKRHHLMASLLPDAELVEIPQAGHLPTLEQPQAVTDALRRWLGR